MKILFVPVIIAAFFSSCKPTKMASASNIQIHALRLKPGEDLRISIEQYVKENNIAAGWIST